MRVSGGTSIIGKDLCDEGITTSIEEILRLNVAAVGMSIFVGSDYERDTLTNLAELVNRCENYGIPVMAVTAVGKELEKGMPVTWRLCCRIAAELGGGLSKPTGVKTLTRSSTGALCPSSWRGDPKCETEREVLHFVHDGMQRGAIGLNLGRNVWQNPHPVAMIKALRAIIHEKATAKHAEIFEEEKKEKGLSHQRKERADEISHFWRLDTGCRILSLAYCPLLFVFCLGWWMKKGVMFPMGKHLVFVGGGHAHLTSLKNLSHFKNPGHQVTLISPSPYHYYSGMGPGMLSGIYQPWEVRFHVKKLAEDRGANFIKGKAIKVDPLQHLLFLDSGEKVHYDVVSFNTGSEVPIETLTRAPADNLFPVKPVINLLKARQTILEAIRNKKMLRFVVVGGGPAGIEISANLLRLLHENRGNGEITLCWRKEAFG